VYTIGAVGNRFGKNGLANLLPGQPRSMADFVRRAQGGLMADWDAVDEPLMQQIAATTGGQYFRATDTDGLLKIYQEIDRLETTRLDGTVRIAYCEWFLALLIPGVLLLLAEQGLAAGRLLRVP
jgi:hypothetical protein